MKYTKKPKVFCVPKFASEKVKLNTFGEFQDFMNTRKFCDFIIIHFAKQNFPVSRMIISVRKRTADTNEPH